MNEQEASVFEVQRLLEVEELDTDFYRGAARPEEGGRIYGGQVIAQALASAVASVEPGRAAHSLHAYFLRAGDITRPVIYRVIRDFDGGSFSNRRVVALQDGRPILNLAASFQRPEEGLAYRGPMPQPPGPEAAKPLADFLTAAMGTLPWPFRDLALALDMRVGQIDAKGADPSVGMPGLPSQCAWFRLPAGLDEIQARTALALVSDYGLINTALLPHEKGWSSPDIQSASLDHAIWFHETPPLGEWLLYTMDSPWSGHGRGLARGTIFTQDGGMIASMTQEGLIRHRP
ncbi:acyl-CoA thioesterase domain-containing protein [uncultured Novosphingobium sp.]|uniref:acyl-CoA thioesterase n=1 Tax=uncultured Novosphingobium sp. TaxID=292277 RepID=UPI00258F7EE9|nr:acyl-CoA thioesterase domain-containing protein [uncultured Novosphingobium sp.]